MSQACQLSRPGLHLTSRMNVSPSPDRRADRHFHPARTGAVLRSIGAWEGGRSLVFHFVSDRFFCFAITRCRTRMFCRNLPDVFSHRRCEFNSQAKARRIHGQFLTGPRIWTRARRWHCHRRRKRVLPFRRIHCRRDTSYALCVRRTLQPGPPPMSGRTAGVGLGAKRGAAASPLFPNRALIVPTSLATT